MAVSYHHVAMVFCSFEHGQRHAGTHTEGGFSEEMKLAWILPMDDGRFPLEKLAVQCDPITRMERVSLDIHLRYLVDKGVWQMDSQNRA